MRPETVSYLSCVRSMFLYQRRVRRWTCAEDAQRIRASTSWIAQFAISRDRDINIAASSFYRSPIRSRNSRGERASVFDLLLQGTDEIPIIGGTRNVLCHRNVLRDSPFPGKPLTCRGKKSATVWSEATQRPGPGPDQRDFPQSLLSHTGLVAGTPALLLLKGFQ
jgi:hypothetical protein